MWGGRGAGRSWGIARFLLLEGVKRPIRVLCARELQNSIGESVHQILCDQIKNLGLEALYTVQAARIIGSNGTYFVFEGIKNNVTKIKSYEGIDYCWVEEANKVSKASWSNLIPTIRKAGSEIIISFNPELETDYTYVRFVKELKKEAISTKKFPSGAEQAEGPDSVSVWMNYHDNPWFPEELRSEMERDRRNDYDHYLNIWEGHCLQTLEGAVYAKELRRATEQGRICTVPWDRSIGVQTFWDLGRADNTAIWFAQRVAMQWRVLAYYEDNGEDITYFLKELQNRPYYYDMHHLPHDGKAKRLGSKLSIEEVLRKAYPGKVRIVPKLSPTDGINAARMVMSQCWFDETECEDGLKALRHYRYAVINGQLSKDPVHDWASDGADAFRYMAVALKSPSREEGVLERLARAVRKPRVQELGRGNSSSSLGWMR